MRFCQANMLCFKALATEIKSATLINQTYSQKYPYLLHESTLKCVWRTTFAIDLAKLIF